MDVQRFADRAVRRLGAFKPVPVLALGVVLAMAAAQASTRGAQADREIVDPGADPMRRSAYSVGPLLDRADGRAGGVIPRGGEIVRARIDAGLSGISVRRSAATQEGALKVTHLETGASVVARIIVDFELETPVALSREAARAIGLDQTSGLHSVLIERTTQAR